MLYFRILPKWAFGIFALFILMTPLGARADEIGGWANPGTAALAPVFKTSDRGIAYVTEKDGDVFWFAEHPGAGYSHVFRGKRTGTEIRGRFISVPKYASTKTGRARFRIEAGGNLRRIGTQSEIPYTIMRPVAMAEVRDQLPRQNWPAFKSSSAADYDGGFEDARKRRFYLRTVGDNVIFFAESRFKTGRRPLAAYVFWGKWIDGSLVFANGDLIAVPKGQRRTSGTFSLGFLDDGRLSGQSNIQFLQSVLAAPMRRTMPVDLLGDRNTQDYEVSIENGFALVEGDIVVGEVPVSGGNTQMALAIADKGKFWPECVVPYDINQGSLVDVAGETDPATALVNRMNVVANINSAVQTFNAPGLMTWRRRQAGDSDWVDFVAKPQLCVNNNGNELTCGFSKLGRAKGKQEIIYSLPTSTVPSLATSILVHEMGHAIGMMHEHTRADRDDFVRVNRAAILPGREGNFIKRESGAAQIGDYDYASIMHYTRGTFARAGMQTIIPVVDNATLGGNSFSAGDLAVLQHFCPAVMQKPGVGKRGDGAGIALSDLDDDGRMNALLMAYNDTPGTNDFRIRQCEYTSNGTFMDCIGPVLEVDGFGNNGKGADLALGDFGGFGAYQDLIIATHDTNGVLKYRICWDFAKDGLSRCSGGRDVPISPPPRGHGLGIAAANIDGNPGDEVVFAYYADTFGRNNLRYIVGSNPTSLAYFHWEGAYREDGSGSRGDGLGVAVFEQAGGGRPEIMFSMLDHTDGRDLFRTLTLRDINTNGIATGGRLEQQFHAHSNRADGAGLAVADVDGDGAQDVVIMSYDDPGISHMSENRFKLRLIRAGGEF